MCKDRDYCIQEEDCKVRSSCNVYKMQFYRKAKPSRVERMIMRLIKLRNDAIDYTFNKINWR